MFNERVKMKKAGAFPKPANLTPSAELRLLSDRRLTPFSTKPFYRNQKKPLTHFRPAQ